jgi:2'-5' RNA ligase
MELNNHKEIFRDQYSIAIMLSSQPKEDVRGIKSKLGNIIGDNYESRFSSGHITINSFLASSFEIRLIIQAMEIFCDSKFPFNLIFNEFGIFVNGQKRTIYVGPEASTKNFLEDFMKLIHKSIMIKNNKKTFFPHVTIGRNLKQNECNAGMELLIKEHVNLEIPVESISDEKMCYVIVKEFFLNGSPEPENIQMSLF